MSNFEDLTIEEREYVLNLPYHLSEASMADDLCAILTEFEFLQYKVLSNKSSQLLITDYDLVEEYNILISEKKKESLRLIQRTLSLCAYIIEKDETQLASQLWGRLSPLVSKPIHREIETHKQFIDYLSLVKYILFKYFPLKRSSGKSSKTYDETLIQVLLEGLQETQKIPYLRNINYSLTSPKEPLIFTLVGHEHQLWNVSVTPDDKKLISQDTYTLKVWDLTAGQQINSWKSEEGFSSFVITSDSKKIISSSLDDYTIKVGDLEKRKELKTLKGHDQHTQIVRSLAITPDGKTLISGSDDGTIKIWDLEAEKQLYTLHTLYTLFGDDRDQPVGALAINPDGKTLISGCDDGTIKIWDLSTREELYNLISNKHPVRSLEITPDGKTLISSTDDNKIKIWDVSNRKVNKLLNFASTQKEIRTLDNISNLSRGVVISPDAKKLLSSGNKGVFDIWNIVDNKKLFTIYGDYHINSIAITPDGNKIIADDNSDSIVIFDLTSRKEICRFKSHSGTVNSITISSNGKQIITAGNNGLVKVWDLEMVIEKEQIDFLNMRLKILSTLEPIVGQVTQLQNPTIFSLIDKLIPNAYKNNLITAIKITPNGKHVISGDQAGQIKLWNLESGKQLSSFHGHIYEDIEDILITPNGKQFISVTSEISIKVWNFHQKKAVYTLNDRLERTSAYLVTPDSKKLIYLNNEKNIKVVNLETGKVNIVIEDVEPSMSVNSGVTPDGKQLIAHSRSDNSIKIWDLDTGKKLKTIYFKSKPFLITPDGINILIIENENEINILDLKTGEQNKTIHMEDTYSFFGGQIAQFMTSNGEKKCKVFSTFGKSLDTNAHHITKVLDLETGETLTLQDFLVSENTIAETKNNKKIICGNNGSTLKICNLENGECLASFTADNPIFSYALSPDGTKIVAGDSVGKIHFLNLENLS